MANPAVVGEDSKYDVLWRRHERPSDQIFIPQVKITFRSGAQPGSTANFPFFADPRPSPGRPGDVLDPRIDPTEMNEIVALCRARWGSEAPAVTGITAVTIWNFVDSGGNVRTDIGGVAGVPAYGDANSQADLGFAVLMDPSVHVGTAFATWQEQDSFLVGHEFGHSLSLRHGNGIDDDGDGVMDEDWNGDDFPDETGDSLYGPNLMQYKQFGTDWLGETTLLTTTRAANQQLALRRQAQLIPDVVVDPVLLPLGSARVDDVGDVPEPHLDVLGLSVIVDIANGFTTFGVSVGRLPDNATGLEYSFVADADNDSTTGGTPGAVNVTAGFAGAELVGRVTVNVTNGQAFATPTVWRFSGTTLLLVQSPNIQAYVLRNSVVVDPAPLAAATPVTVPIGNLIVLKVSNDVRGFVSDPFRFEAVTGNQTGGGGDNNATSGHLMTLVAASFPHCEVDPLTVPAGTVATVHASGLNPSESAYAVLGDTEVGSGTTDLSGSISVTFLVPLDSRLGPRLVTVGARSLTADCILTVTAPIAEPPPTFPWTLLAAVTLALLVGVALLFGIFWGRKRGPKKDSDA